MTTYNVTCAPKGCPGCLVGIHGVTAETPLDARKEVARVIYSDLNWKHYPHESVAPNGFSLTVS